MTSDLGRRMPPSATECAIVTVASWSRSPVTCQGTSTVTGPVPSPSGCVHRPDAERRKRRGRCRRDAGVRGGRDVGEEHPARRVPRHQADLRDPRQVDGADVVEGHAKVLGPSLGQGGAPARERVEVAATQGGQHRAVAGGVGDRDAQAHRSVAWVDDGAQVETAVGAEVPRLVEVEPSAQPGGRPCRPRGRDAVARPCCRRSASAGVWTELSPFWHEEGSSVSDRPCRV